MGPRRWNVITVELSEFDSVQGMSRRKQGLANLNQPRRVILAEAGELRDPRRVANAITLLLTHPDLRSQLDTAAGVDLIAHGHAPS